LGSTYLSLGGPVPTCRVAVGGHVWHSRVGTIFRYPGFASGFCGRNNISLGLRPVGKEVVAYSVSLFSVRIPLFDELIGGDEVLEPLFELFDILVVFVLP
jgi:hypothetical protein